MLTAECVKSLPQRQEIEAGAKAAFCDHEKWMWVQREAYLYLVTTEKNVAGLFQTVIVGEIDVVKISGNRCTLTVKFEVGGLYGVLFHVSYSHGKESADLNDERPQAQISA